MSGSGLDGAALSNAIMVYRDLLVRHQSTINRLNVFPVPDGDTGTNMTTTVDSVVTEIADLKGVLTVAAVCGAISHGSLMGARGNSGVILCQILAGLASACESAQTLEAPLFAEGFASGSAAARAAVVRPAEGTILTVASEASDAATAAVRDGVDLEGILDAARCAAVSALWNTPTLLPVLAEAGVVDAGGAGLVLLYDTLLHVVADRELPLVLDLPEDVLAVVAGPSSNRDLAPGHGRGLSANELRYEVMYLLEAKDETIPAFKEVWAGIGDSIVVVGGDGLYNCHIHTLDIGGAIEAGIEAGRPREIRVTDLNEQVEEEHWVRSGGANAGVEDHPPFIEGTKTAVLAVGTGNGIRRIFRSLGVYAVIAGGQSMNPSTAEILDVLDAMPHDEAVILPNNSNIIAVARQAAELSTKPVQVISTRSIQEGFAALLDYDPEASAHDNADAMQHGASRVIAGEVTQAVRSTTSPVGDIKTGDFIGLSGGAIQSIGDGAGVAACGLIDQLIGENHEIVTLIEGQGASSAETRRITEWLGEHYPKISIEHHDGAQPLYPYLISIE